MASLKIALAAAAAAAVLMVYLYVKDMREELTMRIGIEARNELVVDGLSESIAIIRKDLALAEKLTKSLQESRKDTKAKLDSLEEVLNGHDLDKIASKKSELLRRVYERGLNKYYGDIQRIMEN